MFLFIALQRIPDKNTQTMFTFSGRRKLFLEKQTIKNFIMVIYLGPASEALMSEPIKAVP